MSNKNISTIAKTYAQALIQIAEESNNFEALNAQLEEIRKVIESSKDFQIVMANSSIAAAKKIELLDDIFSNKIDGKILKFLKILVEKNRFNEFNSIIASYNEILDKKSNKKRVIVISAVDLDLATQSDILSRLENKLNCEIVPQWQVDKNIIAGLTFKFDDYVIDTSIRNKIENLSKNISR